MSARTTSSSCWGADDDAVNGRQHRSGWLVRWWLVGPAGLADLDAAASPPLRTRSAAPIDLSAARKPSLADTNPAPVPRRQGGCAVLCGAGPGGRSRGTDSSLRAGNAMATMTQPTSPRSPRWSSSSGATRTHCGRTAATSIEPIGAPRHQSANAQVFMARV